MRSPGRECAGQGHPHRLTPGHVAGCPGVAHTPDEGWGSYLQSPLAGVGPSAGGLMVVSACRVVKEEISADNARLPCFNGRVVSWVSLWDVGRGRLARVGMVPELQGAWAQGRWV